MNKTLPRLSLEEKIGQMIMSRAYGYYYSSEGDEFRRLEHLVKEHKFGGLIFFQGDVYETALLINRLQSMSDVPLLVAGDFEWGIAMRIRRATRFPEAMALGATRDTSLAYEVGKATGEETRAIGVQIDFAPVADVNVNPDNPVINTRSFGENPLLVADMAGAFTSGLQSAGALATAKHFPGHGDTQTDSHLNLPLVSHSRARLDSIELTPFKRLIDRGIASMMVAHLEVPALEEGRALPATLSSSIVTDLLKKRLGFNGLVVTDAMDMGALVNSFGSDSAAVRAVEAGVDILLILPDEDAAVDALIHAVKSGRISEARIDQSVRKILECKWSLGLVENRMVSLDSIPHLVATPEHIALSKRVARNSITVLKNDHILPLQRNGSTKILQVIIADQENYRTEIHRSTSQWPNEPVGDYFTAQLRRRSSNLQTVKLDPTSNTLDLRSVKQKVINADIVLYTIFSKARSGSGQFGLPPELVRMIDSLGMPNKPTIVVAMGSPYILSAFQNYQAYVCSYSDCEASTEATVEALFGEILTHGKLPVTIPEMFPYGTGIDLVQATIRRDNPESVGMDRDSLAKVDSVINRAIRDSAFPGAQVLVARDGAIVYNKSFGHLDYSPASSAVNANTLYDLASITKVVATTSAVMRLYDEGKIRFDDLVINSLPEFNNKGKGKITIRNLLMHNGGLPAFKQLYRTAKSPQEVLDSVFQTELIYRTGDSTVYSDFDFIVLGKIVERITGVTLDKYVDSVFFKPLGMMRTKFNPDSSSWANIAPTEFDSVVRKQIVRGTVHDENAYVLGGVSGHAGLFSTAGDLAIFMQMIMNGGQYGGIQFIRSETITLFTTKASEKGTRALGWDTKTMNGYSSAGSFFGPKTFGHTGFTGTSIWADPEKKLFIIFLTNRVHPTRANTKIMQVRPAVHDAVVRAIVPRTFAK
ncbi:MAG: serine hydrolase [Ignavibacteriae bacterium]|nr:serine hydrolase [Ignavibacteria bacterium]MBI3363650.1 serine hydrolase [Ignavibacteriota bacterium]